MTGEWSASPRAPEHPFVDTGQQVTLRWGDVKETVLSIEIYEKLVFGHAWLWAPPQSLA
jgi:hypothetical protein